jgi:hypothetical protein
MRHVCLDPVAHSHQCLISATDLAITSTVPAKNQSHVHAMCQTVRLAILGLAQR